MSSEKYKQFRNFMTNELGITRNDIEAWTKEAVTTEVNKKLKQIDVEKVVTENIKNIVTYSISNKYSHLSEKIADSLAEQLVKQIKISIN